jgi:recombinational DNA repair protein (RecF pathway)
MSNTTDNWKKVSFGNEEFDAHANAYIAELVDELLREKDIEPSAFAFSIEVDYMEGEDE